MGPVTSRKRPRFLYASLIGLLALSVACGKTRHRNGEQTGGEQTGGEQTGGEPTGGEQTGGEQTGGEPTAGDEGYEPQTENCEPWQPEGAWSSLATARPAWLIQLTASVDGKSLYSVSGWLDRGERRTDVFRSDDGGATWCVIATPEQPARVVVSPADSRVLYVLSAENTRHLMRTTDGGVAWTIGPELPTGSAPEIAASTTDKDTIWLNLDGYALVSTDGAEHWRTIEALSSLAEEYDTLLTIDPTSENRLFALGWKSSGDSSYVGRAFASMDGGESWQESFPPVLNSDVPAPTVFASASGVLWVQLDQTLFASEDWGVTWREPAQLPTSEAELLQKGVNDALFAWDSGAPYPRLWMRTEDAIDWQPVPVPDADFVPFLTLPARIVGHVITGLATTDDAGESWRFLDPIPGSTNLYQSPLAPALWTAHLRTLSSNDGLTWKAAPLNGEPLFDGSNADTVFLRGSERLERSEDGGGSWETLGFPEPIAEIHAAAACPPPESCLYVMYRSPSDEDTLHAARITRSTDRGRTWAEPTPLPAGYYFSLGPLFVLPDSNDHLLASFIDGTAESRDGGVTWTAPDLPNVDDVGSIAVLTDGTLLIAGSNSDGGIVIRSTDNGETWDEVSRTAGGLVVSHAQPDTVFMLGEELLRSDDRGKTWSTGAPEAWSDGERTIWGVADAPNGGFVATVADYGLVGFE